MHTNISRSIVHPGVLIDITVIGIMSYSCPSVKLVSSFSDGGTPCKFSYPNGNTIMRVMVSGGCLKCFMESNRNVVEDFRVS